MFPVKLSWSEDMFVFRKAGRRSHMNVPGGLSGGMVDIHALIDTGDNLAGG